MGLYTFNSPDSRIKLIENRLRRLDDQVPYLLPGSGTAGSTSNYKVVPAGAVNEQNKLDLTNNSVLTLGALAPYTSIAGFGVTATTNSLTWYWDGTNGSVNLVIHRADGTSFSVPGGSITVTGLTANTWYGFLPYWTPYNQCQISWVQGDSGTPQIAFAGGTGASFSPTATAASLAASMQTQITQTVEQLSTGFMTWQIPNVGTNTGNNTGGTPIGGGGAPGRCVMLGTNIETLGDLPYETEHTHCDFWHRVVTEKGRSLNATPNHWVIHPERGKVQLATVPAGDWLLTESGEDKVTESHPLTRRCTRVNVRMAEGHMYWSNGILSHNMAKVALNLT